MKLTDIVINKHTRSYIFLVITVIIIFAINALLPAIEGKTHYTADPVTVTYSEYLSMKEDNEHYNLTWRSEEDIKEYIKEYKKANPEQALDVIVPPDGFQVQVYTKYFFTHSFWYITTLTRAVSAVLLFYSVFNVVLTKHKDTHARYIELNAELVQLSNNSLDPSTFEPWMNDVFNYERKKKQHIENVKYDISLLERRTSYKIRMMKTTDPTNPKYVNYDTKKKSMQERLEPEYIENIVVHKPVRRFKYIQPMFVTCGVNKVGRTTDSYSLIESDNTHLGKTILRKTLMATGLTVMFATLLTITVVTATEKPWYWILIDIITTLAPLVIQIPMAYDYCNSYMEEHLIPNLLSRRSIALLYLAYMQKGKTHEESNITSN